ncbi:MAG: hypothetical protein J6J63_00295, partial [Oscillospiraceae bacterium]|nr:hypothetical protein [Oscillospiraceae bacterium]
MAEQWVFTLPDVNFSSHGAPSKKTEHHLRWHSVFLVDLMGFEPTTSRMRTERSPEWLGYIAPYRKNK